MFTTFTGSSRRPRQVNLSGKNKNPFAQPGVGSGTSGTVQNAQQERERRQQERDRLNAAKNIQRTWRGHSTRMSVRRARREEWDEVEGCDPSMDIDDMPPYGSEEEALTQLRNLTRLFDVREPFDTLRLLRFWRRLGITQSQVAACTDGPWPLAYLRSQAVIIAGLQRLLETLKDTYSSTAFSLLEVMKFVTKRTPQNSHRDVGSLYHVLAMYTKHLIRQKDIKQHEASLVMQTALIPLQANSTSYTTFACRFLCTIDFGQHKDLESCRGDLADGIDSQTLAQSLSKLVDDPRYGGFQEMMAFGNRLNLLSTFIFIYRRSSTNSKASLQASNADFVKVTSTLLSSVADDINLDELQRSDYHKAYAKRNLVSEINRQQILSLVDQESVKGLLYGSQDSDSKSAAARGEEAKQLASYALTLLRFFPKRSDDIRLWLYMSSPSADSKSSTQTPAIKYFWQAMRTSNVFDKISKDSRAAINLLKQPLINQNGWQAAGILPSQQSVQDDWRIILIFFELYTFILRTIDDEEFFSNPGNVSYGAENQTWTAQNALPLSEVKDLITFLKNLGFTMYFNAAEIADNGEKASNTGSLSTYFNTGAFSSASSQEEATLQEPNVAGLPGMSMDYVKGLVTGLLRGIYERDSRRRFLPKGHWLMTSRFDMTAFIPLVVQEEESRHRVQDEDDADMDGPEPEDVFEDDNSHLIGTGRDQRLRHQDWVQRQQRKASRKRFLQAVAPRLEILQNMPFFIPFEVRVQIFREFVNNDQMRRRNGAIDQDHWRAAQMQFSEDGGAARLGRHQGKIRRGHEFDDAFKQFHSLGEGLKEPIQITFVDKFDQPEAGIDGGGVTKEFLTSVTSQAFSMDNGENMFVENDQHLLYPNPAAMDELKEDLISQGLGPSAPEYIKANAELRQRYEFLGRMIGKCLYEGILVDVNFAGFFLLKWALTGGTGSAPKESNYRANLNDLRDLDEKLFKGLIDLKKYDGDVEDLALDFTISDTIKTGPNPDDVKIITRELKPGGADIAVNGQNRLIYISLVARHRLQVQPAQQTSAFLQGLSSMILPTWLSMFNQSELQTLLSGSRSAVDIADLRASTAYGGLYVIGDDGLEHPTVESFWRVMESFSDEDRRAVLKFVTSTPRAPLLGFGSLRPRFSIRDSGNDEKRLPSTSTCVNLLKLPVYRNEGILREKLLQAVHSGAGFDLS